MASVLVLSTHARAATCKPANAQVKTAAWRAYRAKFPFLMQGVARMQGAPGCTVIVIGEPPPALQVPALLASVDVAEDPANVLVAKHSFGGDGWTKDLVFTIDSGTPERAAETISTIHQQVFGTSFRAWTIDLDSQASVSTPIQLDLQITAGDLRAWLFAGHLTFTSVVGGAAQSARQLLEGARPGVYESTSPPLVAWVVDAKRHLDDSAVEARQFTMASDLVIGAVLSETRMVVVARSRIAPFETLPPLRTETLRLLANAKDSLAQSYERNSPLAGPAGHDSVGHTSWAPVYLSPELIDTELGSLLNLADQLLKSWSNAGKTRYVGFSYPDPPRWPFGTPSTPESVVEYLAASSLTYNWNTNDFATAFDDGRYGVMAFRSTGALPLDYLLDSSTTSSGGASAVGRAYFAGLGDPNLVRVVQYSALYHAFQLANAVRSQAAFDVRSLFAGPRPAPGSAAIEDGATAMVTAFALASDATLQRVAGELFDAAAATDPNLQPVMRPLFLNRVTAIRHHAPFATASELNLRALAKRWTSPQGVLSASQQDEIEACGTVREVMQRLVDIDQLRADYQRSRPEPANGWIRTSTWVASTDPALQGGHNLDFAVHALDRLPPARRWQDALQTGAHTAIVPTTGGRPAAPGVADRPILEAYRTKGAIQVVRLERADDHYRSSFGDRPQPFISFTLADATDTIASVARTQDPRRPIRIYLERFTAAEAHNFRAQAVRAIRAMGGKHDIEIVARRGAVDLEQAKKLARVVRFDNLELEHVQPEPATPHVVEATITQPRGRVREFFLKIRLRFREAVSEPVRARVSKVIQAAFAALGRSGSRLDAAALMNRYVYDGLHRAGLDATVEIANEAEDVVVVELARPAELSRS